MNRRSLITGLISFVAAPAIVRINSLMPVKAINYSALDNLIEDRIKNYDMLVDKFVDVIVTSIMKGSQP